MSGHVKSLRLLAVNPNMTAGVTEAFVQEARKFLPDTVTIDGVTGEFGATIVSTEAENAVAGHAALDLLAHHADGYDAVIMAISFDTALLAAREVLSVPVIGITEAMLQAAAVVSDRVGFISFGEAGLPLYQRLVRSYGLESSIAAWHAIDIASPPGFLDPSAQDRAVHAAIDELLQSADVTAVVICGTAIVGMAGRLQTSFDIPVFDSGRVSVEAALTAIASEPCFPRSTRPLSRCHGISAELAALISGA